MKYIKAQILIILATLLFSYNAVADIQHCRQIGGSETIYTEMNDYTIECQTELYAVKYNNASDWKKCVETAMSYSTVSNLEGICLIRKDTNEYELKEHLLHAQQYILENDLPISIMVLSQ